MKTLNAMVAVMMLCISGFIAAENSKDKIAVVEPVANGGLEKQQVEALWSILESKVDGGFEVVSRSAIKSMMTEIGLTTSSNLVDLNSSQKAKLGKLKTVKCLLVSSFGKVGTKLSVSLKVLDASTGEIDSEKSYSDVVSDMDELMDKLDDILQELDLGKAIKLSGRCAVLDPIVTVKKAPDYLKSTFGDELQSLVMKEGVKLYNLNSVNNILNKNKIGSLDEVEPSMYVRIGKLLRTDHLIQPRIDRFEHNISRRYIKASKRNVITSIGNIGGNIKVISTKTGDVISSSRFKLRIDFSDVEVDMDDWVSEDYGVYLIEQVLPNAVKKAIAPLKK